MRKLLLLLFCLMPALIFAQQRLEKRVYYLDCSGSMVTLKLWNPVREDLKKAIDEIKDENTIIEIICFAYDNSHEVDQKIPDIRRIYASKANRTEIERVKREISQLPKPSANNSTFHDVPFIDFICNGRIDPSRDTYMFLMTDGKDEYGLNKKGIVTKTPKGNFDNNVKKYWHTLTTQKNVFGFYVQMSGAADSERRQLIHDNTDYFWYLETADVDVNTIRTDKNKYSVNYNSSVQIYLKGKKNLYGVDPELNFADKYYDLQYSYSNGVLTISPRIKSGVPAKVIPESDTIKIKLNTKEGVKHNNKSLFNIIVDEELDLIVTCNQNPISFSQAKDDIYNVRNSKSFTLTPKGNLSKVEEIIVWFEDSTNLYAKTEIDRTNNKLRIYPLLKTDSTYYINMFSGQSVQDFKIHYSVKSKDPFSYIDGENSAIVKFEGKWEKWLTTSIEACDKSKSLFATISSWLSSENESSLGTITYYPSFLWKEENTTRSKAKWNLTFTKDALGIEGTKVKLEFCDKYGNPLDTAQYKIYVNNKLCDANIFEVTNKMTQLDVNVWMKPGTSSHPWWGTDEFEGNLKVIAYNNLIGINDYTINEATLVLPWTVVYEKELNPLVSILLLLLALVLLSIVIFYVYLLIKAAISPKFSSNYQIEFCPNAFFDNQHDHNFELNADNKYEQVNPTGNIIFSDKLHCMYVKELLIVPESYEPLWQTWLDKKLNGIVIIQHCDFHNSNIKKIELIPIRGNQVLCKLNDSNVGVIKIRHDGFEDSNRINLNSSHIFVHARRKNKPNNNNN